MTDFPVRRLGILLATASFVIAACSPNSGGGSGDPVIQPQPVTVTTGFDFTATGTFTVGESPANATYTDGVATGGFWVIPDGETGVVTFTSPTRDLSFTVEGLDPNSAAARFAKSAFVGAARKTTCGLEDQGLDNSEALGQEMFMRGGFNDWGNPSPPDEFLFINFGE
ncbi:MAG: hypothetical protein OES37_08090, partial [Chromatiales bacterium]|nr:hypothetical protein [Chromatiales bacterium]